MATTEYELVLMLDPETGDEERGKIASEAKSKLESKGTLTHEATWGMRKMAYEIERRTEADYRYYRFSGDKPLLDDLNHALGITDGVLRFRIFKLEADAPVIVPPDTEQIMRRDEDDDRGRGRGRRDDRGPRRPPESESRAAPAEPAPAAESAAAPEGSPEAPAPAAAPPADEAPVAAPADADPADPAPAEPAPEDPPAS